MCPNVPYVVNKAKANPYVPYACPEPVEGWFKMSKAHNSNTHLMCPYVPYVVQ